jgi:hypothetical protein
MRSNHVFKKIFYLLIAIEVSSILLAFNYPHDAFLKYGSTDTVVYYIISKYGIFIDNGEEFFWGTAQSYGFITNKETFLIAHQVYRFFPYIVISKLSNLLNLETDVSIAIINYLINILILFIIYKKIKSQQYIIFNNYKVKILLLLLIFSIPYSFKMWSTVPYLINYPLFVLFSLVAISMYEKDRYIEAFILLILAASCRQSAIAVAIAIFLHSILQNKNILNLRTIITFFYCIFIYGFIKFINTIIIKYGYTDITNNSFIGIFLIDNMEDLISLLIIFFKLLLSFSALLYLIYEHNKNVNKKLNIYGITGILLILQPVLGGLFTGLSISIVSGLSVPFLIIGNIKTILNNFEKIILLKNKIYTCLAISLFIISLHPSWDYIGRMLCNFMSIKYINIFFIGELIFMIYVLYMHRNFLSKIKC